MMFSVCGGGSFDHLVVMVRFVAVGRFDQLVVVLRFVDVVRLADKVEKIRNEEVVLLEVIMYMYIFPHSYSSYSKNGFGSFPPNPL